MITAISKLPCYQRLPKCGFLSLQDRRKMADMLEVFKIINGFSDVDTKRIFELNHTPRPGRHNKSIVWHHSRLDARHKFFSQRVIKTWDTLSSTLSRHGIPYQALYQDMGYPIKHSIKTWDTLSSTLSRHGIPYQALYQDMGYPIKHSIKCQCNSKQ